MRGNTRPFCSTNGNKYIFVVVIKFQQFYYPSNICIMNYESILCILSIYNGKQFRTTKAWPWPVPRPYKPDPHLLEGVGDRCIYQINMAKLCYMENLQRLQKLLYNHITLPVASRVLFIVRDVSAEVPNTGRREKEALIV